jgi:hypothetical protein
VNPIDDAVIVDACTLKKLFGRRPDRRPAPLIGQIFALTEAAKAREAIEGLGIVAKTLLLTG